MNTRKRYYFEIHMMAMIVLSIFWYKAGGIELAILHVTTEFIFRFIRPNQGELKSWLLGW